MAYVKLGNKAVGDIVKLSVNGTLREFIVIQHGRPGTSYPETWIKGTVLLMNDAFFSIHEGSASGNYNHLKSPMYTYVTDQFRSYLDLFIVENMLASMGGGAIAPFLLSIYELGLTASYAGSSGNRMDYFLAGNSGSANAMRIAKTSDGFGVTWWLRDGWYVSVEGGGAGTYWSTMVNDNGSAAVRGVQPSYIRPAMAVQSSLYVTDDGRLTTNQPPTAPGSISYNTPRAGKPLTVTLTPATDPD